MLRNRHGGGFKAGTDMAWFGVCGHKPGDSRSRLAGYAWYSVCAGSGVKSNRAMTTFPRPALLHGYTHRENAIVCTSFCIKEASLFCWWVAATAAALLQFRPVRDEWQITISDTESTRGSSYRRIAGKTLTCKVKNAACIAHPSDVSVSVSVSSALLCPSPLSASPASPAPWLFRTGDFTGATRLEWKKAARSNWTMGSGFTRTTTKKRS